MFTSAKSERTLNANRLERDRKLWSRRGRETHVIAIIPGLIVLSLLLSLAGCENGSMNKTASVKVTAGSSGVSTQAFKGTAGDITRVAALAYNGATLLDSLDLTDTGSGWEGSLYNLPVGPTLTITGQGFNASGVKIFEGSVSVEVIEGGNQITIPLNPLDDGTGFPLPSIVGIAMPASISISSSVSVDISVHQQGEASLDYVISAASGGGTFSSLSGSVPLDGSGNGEFTLAYTAPAAGGTYSHSVTVTNSQQVSSTAAFNTVVGLGPCVLDNSYLDNCTLTP